ncbi:PrsW family intramembrane metalloprotease [Streptomyces sp. NPDC003077]|uniref:PrsW family intramembrane metalloprotease n=1 Tax=Streptomyces sp. NPDC003077 TaxID=3154443 RepID=UPI0033B12CAD
MPAYAPRTGFTAAPPVPARWPHGPRRAAVLWRGKTARATALICLLALSGAVILAMVREQTGTQGFLVGLGLAVFPVPLLVAAFCWLDRVEPEPWRNLAFAFAWGACAATLLAILANGFATDWLAGNLSTSPADAETWGAAVVAPVVEESVKAVAVLLLFLFRRRDFRGITDGIVVAGISATGFAFTENVLYLGNAFGEDQNMGHTGLDSYTAGTFFVRIIMSPFAHPLFTILTGLAFGIAATHYPNRRSLRVALPIVGLLTAILLHSIWNSAANLGQNGFLGGFAFLTVYGLFMVPVFATLTWLAIWIRHRDLLSLRTHLLPYVTTGWLAPTDPLSLSSFKTRSTARALARHAYGPDAARAVTTYATTATTLAFLRHRARRRGPGPDFAAREHQLLQRLWQHRPVAEAALGQALWLTRRGVYGPGAYPVGHPAYGGTHHLYGGPHQPYGGPGYPYGPYGRG